MAPDFYRDIQPHDLPIPNKRVMQLIQYAMKDDAKVEILTRLIAINPALSAQVLGLVNSAFFGFRQQIRSISDAVIVMGMKRLRNIVLCFAVKEALSRKKIDGFDIDSFWEDCIRRSVAAHQLCLLVDGPVEEAFVAGMLLDVGLLVLFLLEPEKSDRWPLLRSNTPEKRREMEKKLFEITHDEVGAMLVKKWHLPKPYLLAIEQHHHLHKTKKGQRGDGLVKYSSLPSIMMMCDLCNAVFTCHDKALALSVLNRESKNLFKLSEKTIASFLMVLPRQVKETAGVLNMPVSSQTDFNHILEQASHRIIEENINFQELTWRLQDTLKQRDEYAAKLETELRIAREIQKSLQPDNNSIAHIDAFNTPALQLSGDFYDYFPRQDKKICFCLGDVSGKGTSAAILMAKTISLFRCLCKVVDDISQVIYLMNDEICDTAVRGMFVTFVAGLLDPVSKELQLINAGHLPPFLVNNKKIMKIDAKNPPLGILPGISHDTVTCSLAKSRLY
ncbi:MAG: HDOD domain-containing protein, partial [Desulfobacteraceae bacterium]|nr:HDOD domain-containing protein [Desulfobacteraceae bacterium]